MNVPAMFDLFGASKAQTWPVRAVGVALQRTQVIFALQPRDMKLCAAAMLGSPERPVLVQELAKRTFD